MVTELKGLVDISLKTQDTSTFKKEIVTEVPPELKHRMSLPAMPGKFGAFLDLKNKQLSQRKSVRLP